MIKQRGIRYAAGAALVLGCLAAAIAMAARVVQTVDAPAPWESAPLSILVDPGHGGQDGGAVAADGTVEKEINLAVSLPLADMLRVMGFPVALTRDTDRMVCDEGLSTLRERKNSDLNNRLKMSAGYGVTVSIHQNHFSQSQYFGTQIFYGSRNPESQPLADAVRLAVVGLLQPENKRELKKTTSDIYLLSGAETPAILVECGFLSNPDERAKLKDVEYQRQMAFAVACGILSWMN